MQNLEHLEYYGNRGTGKLRKQRRPGLVYAGHAGFFEVYVGFWVWLGLFGLGLFEAWFGCGNSRPVEEDERFKKNRKEKSARAYIAVALLKDWRVFLWIPNEKNRGTKCNKVNIIANG